MLAQLLEMIRQRHNRQNLYTSAEYWDSKAATYDDSAVSMWPNQALNQLYEAEQKELISHYMGRVEGLSLLD